VKEFELGEENFNEMAGLIELFIILHSKREIGFGQDDRLLSGLLEAYVCMKDVVLHLRQQNIGTSQIGCLVAGEMKSDRVTQGIDDGMNFGAQSLLCCAR